MGLFNRAPQLDSKMEVCMIASGTGDASAVAKVQSSLLAALEPNETMLWVTSDIDLGNVMAATSSRIIGFYKSRIEVVLPGSRIVSTEIRQSQFYGSRTHSYKHSLKVTWSGGPLPSTGGGQYPNMFLWITRWEYSEINQMDTSLQRQFRF